MIIDAHQHLWNMDLVEYPWLIPEYGPIYRNFVADDIEPLLSDSGIDKTILIQAANSDADTEYMLSVAKERAWVGGVVGWVHLNDPVKAAQQLEFYSQTPIFKGVRHLINEEVDPDWVIRSEVLEGLSVLASFGMTFDVVAVYPKHIHHIHTLVEKVPNLKIVIDHLAKPPIKSQQISPWEQSLREVAKYENVFAKLSGLGTEADHETWTAEDIKPYIDVALDAFGVKRLMYGGDWPVSVLSGGYKKYWEQIHKALCQLTPAQKNAIFSGTASTFYRV